MLAKSTYVILFSAMQHQRRDLSTVKQTTKCDYFCAPSFQMKDKYIYNMHMYNSTYKPYVNLPMTQSRSVIFVFCAHA